MLINNFIKLGKGVFKFGSSFASVGKYLALQGRDKVLELLEEGLDKNPTKPKKPKEHDIEAEARRQNMLKNFEVKEVPEDNNAAIQAKMESMKHSQGTSDFSGSSYDGPDSPGQRTNYNRFQRNYENHQRG